MAQKSTHSVLGLPAQLHARIHTRLHLATCLFRIPNVRISSALSFTAFTSLHFFCSLNRRNSTNGVILIVSAVCSILSVTEIILFAASRLHPLTYLLLQLVKMITWFVLFVQAAVDTTRVNNEMEGEDKQGYSLGDRSEYFYLQWFAEPLVLL